MSTETPAADHAANDATTHVEGVKVFAGNLTYGTDEAALKNFFSEFTADILSTQIIQHGFRSAGYGFVTFNTEAAATNAIQALDKKDFNGRAVIVERAKPLGPRADRPERRYRNKFGGRRGSKAVPGEATEPNAQGDSTDQALAANDDDTAQTEMKKKKKSPKKRTKKPATEAAVDGAAPDPTTVAVDADGVPSTDRFKRTRKPKFPKRPRGETPKGEPSSSVLFVANLGFSVDEAQLTEFFATNGIIIKSARVVRRRWGTPRKSKGYAFVDVGGPEDQKKAIEAASGKTIGDREVTVKIAVDSPHRDDGKDAAADQAEPVVAVA